MRPSIASPNDIPAWINPDPQREAIAVELHARPVLPLGAPVRVRRAVFLSGEGKGSLGRLHRAIVGRAGLGPENSDPEMQRQCTYMAGSTTVVFELHNEFATLTWHTSLTNRVAWPSDIGLELFSEMTLVAATRVDLVATETIAAPALAGFNPSSLCFSDLYGGKAQIATDFLRDDLGYTRYEVAAARCGPIRCGVIVRRLLEVETYSNLVLLGLPLARRHGPAIAAAEAALAENVARIGDARGMGDNREALDRLNALSVSVGTLVEATSFRFAASRAYGQVLRTRLARLHELPTGEFTSMERYLSNRIEPALATCAATERRLDRLTATLQRSTQLLDTRIGLSLQIQNQSVLDSIARTAQGQFRLQETVEGLSIIAITYYALGILGYVVDGLAHLVPLSKSLALLIAAPFVLLLVWSGLRQVRRSHRKPPGGE